MSALYPNKYFVLLTEVKFLFFSIKMHNIRCEKLVAWKKAYSDRKASILT